MLIHNQGNAVKGCNAGIRCLIEGYAKADNGDTDNQIDQLYEKAVWSGKKEHHGVIEKGGKVCQEKPVD